MKKNNNNIKILEDNIWKYISFNENNDWEWETWTFYLEIDNTLIEFYKYYLKSLEIDDNLWYEDVYFFDFDLLDVKEVDIIVDNSDYWYMQFLNWPFILSSDKLNKYIELHDILNFNDLYKWQILNFV